MSNLQQDIRFEGELKYGKYNGGHLDDTHPKTVEKYTSSSAEEPNLAQMIADDQESNIRHDAVDPPKQASPFIKPASEEIFWKALRDLDKEDIIPGGFGIAQNEWEDGSYPEVESISIARKDVNIILPFSIWWPRAVHWARTLELILQLCILEE